MTEIRNSDAEERMEPWLRVESLKELMENEQEILKRIADTPNGGQLFLIHPFQLLKDIGVALSARAEEEIRRREPHLSGLSPIPYQALRNSRAEQPIRVNLHGLFERR